MKTGSRILTFPRVSVFLLVLQSILLLQFPLLNVLGLEFSVATAPLVALLAGFAVLLRADSPASEVSPYLRFADGARRSWYLLVIPGVLALLNAGLVRNCDPLGGIAYYALVVPFGGAFGIAIALFANALFPRSARSATVLLLLATLLHIVAVTFFGPQIFAYNPIVGFFPGLSYDSTLSVLPSLLLYRCCTVVFIVALLETVRLIQGPRPATTTDRRRSYGATAVVWGLTLAAWFGSDALGFSSSLSRIRDELGGVLETEHFVIIYPKDRLSTDEADRFGEYHEFLYHSLSRTLRVETSRRIVSAYYASTAQKAALVGGGGTNFTKPWLWQMHLAFDDRDRVLKHELVHILAAEFGFPLIRVGLNSGFIEGLAVAMEREAYGMPLDRAAASIVRVRGNADISSVFSLTGFFRSNASVSYTLAGSFCRHLIERYGIRRFKRAYRSGSFNAYGRSFNELVSEWQLGLSRIRLDDGETIKARYLFDRPPGFTEECFQYKGNTLRDAQAALRAGQDSLAIGIAMQTYQRSPSFDGAYVLAQGLIRNDQAVDALSIIEAQAARDTGVVFLPLSLVYGDALWAVDSADVAARAYRQVRMADLSDGWTETSAFRLALMEQWGYDPEVRRMVVRSVPDSVRREFFRERAARLDDPVLWYALARWLPASEYEDEVLDVLPRAMRVEEPFLRYVVKWRMAALHRSRREYERGKAILWEAQNDVHDEVRLRGLMEGIDWLDWLEKRMPKGGDSLEK